MYLIGYNNTMIKIFETDVFKTWMQKMKDTKARSIINARIRRLSFGSDKSTQNQDISKAKQIKNSLEVVE
jgi:putative component of toxin-antitoxin plasmid stabilization module